MSWIETGKGPRVVTPTCQWQNIKDREMYVFIECAGHFLPGVFTVNTLLTTSHPPPAPSSTLKKITFVIILMLLNLLLELCCKSLQREKERHKDPCVCVCVREHACVLRDPPTRGSWGPNEGPHTYRK